jgi:type II secretory pathway pseudopilin PulG
MKRRNASPRGFTLVELVASMAGAGILVAGMASTMFVALRASNPATTSSAAMLTALTCLADMSAELQYARSLTVSSSPTAISATVPDRSDADAAPETVRYAWSGAGQPLTRQFNGGAAAIVCPSVHSLTVAPYPAAPAAAKYLTVRVQLTNTTRSVVETSISLLNLE